MRGEENGVKVFSRIKDQSKIQELKVELNLKARLSSLAAIILEADDYIKWSYNTKLAYSLKKVSKNEIYFYKEVKLPWPLSDRDLVVHLTIMQDPVSKVMTIKGISTPDFIPHKKDLVRIGFSNETWTVIPIDKTGVKISYYLEIDPGESAPAWLVNLFSTKGPLESFKNLAVQVQLPKYQLANISFIKN